ncbi:hypothetical protein FE374_02220 [Georgenia yuyongxinii]|uniref:DNA modification methylase n=1 Tax=Georgenia yuyongxinii TaxID=2589797 RepID=A0A5B8BYW7_9MICO|nr:hypothetical protein [Georgenia yuyongxinii]QDC23599.1 hypothetical protein FE374_02220 [Georgenia yuyongxinii]
MARTIRRSAIAATMLGAALVLAGCSVANPITTQMEYAPSDGIRVEVADGVVVENLMVLTESEGGEGHVVGAVVNRSRENALVTLSLGEGNGVPVRVPAGKTANLLDDGVRIASVDVAPGGLLPSTVGLEDGAQISVSVPVLDGTIPPYDEVLGQA